MDNFSFSVVVPHGIKHLTSIIVTDQNGKVLTNFKRGRVITLKEGVVINDINVGGRQGFVEHVVPKRDMNSSKIKVDFGSLISEEPIELSLIKLCNCIAV